MALNEEQRNLLMEIVSDPRFTQESNLVGLPLAAALKEAVIERGLVDNLNSAYGWSMPKDMMLNGRQTNDVIYEIVLKPGYLLEKFLEAIKSGKRL
jgi:hypothetical protein